MLKTDMEGKCFEIRNTLDELNTRLGNEIREERERELQEKLSKMKQRGEKNVVSVRQVQFLIKKNFFLYF